jgi:hypothetical protein
MRYFRMGDVIVIIRGDRLGRSVPLDVTRSLPWHAGMRRE